uniref:F-box domain-containing protein n=1 Tax=Strongyloides venezuelensis TaxID=75913 RepID=A0A0K0F7T0_STRVS
MDLDLSLPPEIWARVFLDIPWNQIVSFKLTSKEFCYVTEKYLGNMQKSKMSKINFENNSSHNYDISRIKEPTKFL